MDDAGLVIIADDIDLINEQLKEFSGYDFAVDVATRMQALGLSQSALAARVHLSHAAVGKWLNKGARPHGKERFKELGMALGMDEAQLNAFLQANCYPKLYTKNPLDAACRFVLSASAGNEHIVSAYRDFLRLYKLDSYVLNSAPADISTAALSRAFADVKSVGSLEAWLAENERHFRAFDKSYIANSELIHFVIMYIDGQSINSLYIAGELPVTIKNLLHPLIADKEIAVKGLRAKLIVFGLYVDMNEHEINIMLNIAKLRAITEPSARIDHVILTALRCAHERYPYFELSNAEKVLKSIEKNDMPDLRGFYEEQKRRAEEFIGYYETSGNKSELDRLFEQTYTDYAGSGILHYIKDILAQLVKTGVLTTAETDEYTALMQTY